MSTPERDSVVHSTMHNDHLTVIVTRKPRCHVTFDITVSPQATSAAYHRALKNISREVTVPGFRKGKAPADFIRQKYGSAIQQEFVDVVLQTGFEEAVQLTSIHPLKEGHMERPIVHSCSLEQGAHFTLAFEARPTIPTVDLNQLHLRRFSPIPITEEQRQRALHNVVLQFATYEPILDRTVEEGDFVNITLTLLTTPPKEILQNQRVEVKATELPFWARTILLRLKANESAEGMTEPESPSLAESEGESHSPLPFRLTVHAIWKGNLPVVDDELARRAGCASTEELRQKIEDHLQRNAEEEALSLTFEALERFLVEKYPIDLPKSYIDSNKKIRLENYLREQKIQGDVGEEYHLQLEQAIEQRVLYDLQLFFLLQKVAHIHQIVPNEGDVLQEWQRQLLLLSRGNSNLDFSATPEKQHEQLRQLAVERKIRQFLLDHALSPGE